MDIFAAAVTIGFGVSPNGKCVAIDALAELGRRVRAARTTTGMTRTQLADASGASLRYLAHIEAGTGNPSLSLLIAIAGALDVAVADLLPLGGERDVNYYEATAAVRRLSPTRLSALNDWISNYRTDKANRIVLVGLRGAGKTSLGKQLAKRLDMPFFEISGQIEQAYGGDLSLLIELGGQAALHKYETQAWEGMRAHPRAVISAPGAVVADLRIYDRVLLAAHTIWLQASPEDHMDRLIAQGDFRPVLGKPSAMDDLRAILEARSPEYARADAHLDTSAQSFDETVDLLCELAARLLAS